MHVISVVLTSFLPVPVCPSSKGDCGWGGGEAEEEEGLCTHLHIPMGTGHEGQWGAESHDEALHAWTHPDTPRPTSVQELQQVLYYCMTIQVWQQHPVLFPLNHEAVNSFLLPICFHGFTHHRHSLYLLYNIPDISKCTLTLTTEQHLVPDVIILILFEPWISVHCNTVNNSCTAVSSEISNGPDYAINLGCIIRKQAPGNKYVKVPHTWENWWEWILCLCVLWNF